MVKLTGLCIVAIVILSVAAAGFHDMDLDGPVRTEVKVSRTSDPLEAPVIVLPYTVDGGMALGMYDIEAMYDMAIAVPVPPPVTFPDMYIPLPEVPDDPTPSEPVRLDVLFCLDTTGSMCDEIAVAKETILDIVAAVAAGSPPPDVRYGLVIYRDLGDNYVTIVHDFMDPEGLAAVLQTVEAAQGGDYEESVSEALTRSVLDVTWDVAASCAIYLIGDAPPHTDYDNGFDHLHAARLAADTGIVINAIGCSGIRGNEAAFYDVVNLTGGQFVYLNYTAGGGSSGNLSYECYDYGLDGDGCIPCCDISMSRGGGDNNLDEVLTDMLRSMAEDKGVEYDD